MISQVMSGSRLPVGSSAMMRRGSWTRARAIAVRCCSPPESVVGSWSAWAPSPTTASARSTAGRIRPRGVPVTSSANATFSRTERVGRSLKSWKTMPIVRRSSGTFRRGTRARSRPSTTTSPLVGSSSRIRSLRSVDLPAPDGPTRKTNSPSPRVRSTSWRAALPFGIDLADAAQGEDRASRCGDARGRIVRRWIARGGRPEDRGVVTSGRGYHRPADPSGPVAPGWPSRLRSGTARPPTAPPG